MIPGMNPRMMKQAMKRMGIRQEDIDAKEVIIVCQDKRIVIENPSVAKVNMMGQETYQVAGSVREEALDTTPDIVEDDIKTVMEQTGCSREEAQKAVRDAEGDLAQAILSLKS